VWALQLLQILLPTVTFAPKSSKLALDGNRLKEVVVATSIEDEDTDLGLAFKRQRVDDVEAPSHSVTDGRAPSFRDNPPSASFPCDLIVHEGGGESTPEDHQTPFAIELPAILQQALRRFQDREVVESLGGNLRQDRVAQSLGDFLITSSLALSKA